MHAPALVILLVWGVSGDSDLIGQESIETASSPLAKLLATASGVGGPILPLAPEHFRPKRKPQRFSLGGERPRFKPRGRQPATERPVEVPETNEIPATEVPLRKKFSGFQRRGRPTPPRFQPQQPQETTEAAVETVPPTEASRFQLEDFFGTPEPVREPEILVQDDLVESERSIPIPLSNSVANERNILDEVRARTIAITGAQPVGVTKDVSTRSKGARNLGAPRRDGVRKKAGRRQEKIVREELDDFAEERPEVEVPQRNSVISAPRRKNPIKPGRKTHSVGTVERYRYENEDGSITWGYENEDGSYKEEEIGVDCVTRGKYGYIDPSGEVREYSYTSGVPCDPLTRKIESAESNVNAGANGHGFYDYARQKFVMPDGRSVRVVVNQRNRARGTRY